MYVLRRNLRGLNWWRLHVVGFAALVLEMMSGNVSAVNTYSIYNGTAGTLGNVQLYWATCPSGCQWTTFYGQGWVAVNPNSLNLAAGATVTWTLTGDFSQAPWPGRYVWTTAQNAQAAWQYPLEGIRSLTANQTASWSYGNAAPSTFTFSACVTNRTAFNQYYQLVKTSGFVVATSGSVPPGTKVCFEYTNTTKDGMIIYSYNDNPETGRPTQVR